MRDSTVELVRRNGPLADPSKVLTISLLLVTGGYATYQIVIIIAAEVSAAHSSSYESSALGQAIALIFVLLLISLQFCMLRFIFQPKVLLLRAFRGDRDDRAVRPALRAGMGRAYRLCGIRPPNERASWISRMLLFGSDGLRYVGSDRLDLEAGKSWLVRLLITSFGARLVAFDLRHRTEQVDREVAVLVSAVGLERSLFFVDSEAERASVAEWIAKLVTDASSDSVRAATIAVGELTPVEVTEKIRARRDAVEGHVGNPDRAWELVRSLSRAGELWTPLWERDLTRTVILIAGGWLIYTLLYLTLPPSGLNPEIPLTVLNMCLLVAVYLASRRLRTVGRAADAMARQIGERWPTWAATISGYATLTIMLLSLCSPLVLPRILAAKAEAQKLVAGLNLQELHSLVLLHRMQTGRLPNAEELSSLVGQEDRGSGENQSPLHDPWGSPYKLESSSDWFSLRSAGPDRAFATEDDIIVEEDGAVRRR